MVAGEHSRELITSEIAFWLGKLLSGQGQSDIAEWDAYDFLQAKAWEHGLTKEKLVDWVEAMLKRIVFKVCGLLGNICALRRLRSTLHHAVSLCFILYAYEGVVLFYIAHNELDWCVFSHMEFEFVRRSYLSRTFLGGRQWREAKLAYANQLQAGGPCGPYFPWQVTMG